ncbi:hypothetical protein BKA67DRAFT_570641 [Truncatella angustata]|uniref:Uncharacterized protein n=1 Tax=Truncatella angustata TaxID=152316 RepID=A0A9P8ZX55_9PEZI|nr:uncharacterized protein BKA67DRAFT_570641 [Truncatella angustata]KAH6653627.1 hypothetical protein BKA67DRAFT_570641 [Truncatella angustata]
MKTPIHNTSSALGQMSGLGTSYTNRNEQYLLDTLRIIRFAKRPLTTFELQGAMDTLKCHRNIGKLRDPSMSTKEFLRDYADLITITTDREKGRIVRLSSREAFQHCLLQAARQNYDGQPLMTDVCLDALLSDKRTTYHEGSPQALFVDYAATYWPYHLSGCPSDYNYNHKAVLAVPWDRPEKLSMWKDKLHSECAGIPSKEAIYAQVLGLDLFWSFVKRTAEIFATDEIGREEGEEPEDFMDETLFE